MKSAKRSYEAPDGASWKVRVTLPSHSSALVLFQHSDGQSVAGDRYAWIQAPDAGDPREHLKAKKLLEGLSDADIATLFRKSMAVSRN